MTDIQDREAHAQSDREPRFEAAEGEFGLFEGEFGLFEGDGDS